ncbi:long-chain fatty acid--CoA ligase [Schaalia sp. JY-X159]|uniref:AMP-dependent synthetase/ligase n=1 Tax=Schaalia sp. JY-X159 TaxID=2758575 RepID=UPI001CB71322|nr:AMP-dependent synthetase/ligase [Schaalia sp. JY-X159]
MYQLDDGTWTNPAEIPVSPDLSIPQLLFDREARGPHQVMVERLIRGEWYEVTAEEFMNHILKLARGLYGLGIRPGDRVAILAATSYEWAAFDMAILSLGAITIPIYESDSAAQISHILQDAEVSLVVTYSVQQAELVESVADAQVKKIFALERGDERKIIQAGQDVPEQVVRDIASALNLETVATIVYTSGTTGLPKGVVLTHGNFVRGLMQAYDILPDLISNPKNRTLLFLPVAHVLARFVMVAILVGEGRLGMSPDIRHLVHDIQTFKPTFLLAVPRVLEKVYGTASQTAGKGIKKTLFGWSAKQSRKMSQATAFPIHKAPKKHPKKDGDEVVPDQENLSAATYFSEGPGLPLKVTHKVADALVLRKIRAILGPNLTTIICGGAPLSPELADFYRGIGITLLQGYGLTETTGPVTVQLPTDFPPDSVGYLWPGNFLKIADDGELLLSGVSVTRGYHNLPEETAEAFTDGWFHSGDLGEVDENGRLRITGRKKELIVTAGGKNVSPDVLQQSLSTHPLISQCVIVGDGRPYIGAVLTLDTEMLPIWLRNKGLKVVQPAEAALLPEVRESLERALKKANHGVSRAESIRRYRILDTEFSIENGYLTPSQKLKRSRVLRDYEAFISGIYDLSESELTPTGGSLSDRSH